VISGSMPVMNLDGWTWEENTLRQSAGLLVSYPGAGGGGRGGGGGGRGAAPAAGPTPASTRSSSAPPRMARVPPGERPISRSSRCCRC
jgi:hypothetical protein